MNRPSLPAQRPLCRIFSPAPYSTWCRLLGPGTCRRARYEPALRTGRVILLRGEDLLDVTPALLASSQSRPLDFCPDPYVLTRYTLGVHDPYVRSPCLILACQVRQSARKSAVPQFPKLSNTEGKITTAGIELFFVHVLQWMGEVGRFVKSTTSFLCTKLIACAILVHSSTITKSCIYQPFSPLAFSDSTFACNKSTCNIRQLLKKKGLAGPRNGIF
jgi:hypothetical protein